MTVRIEGQLARSYKQTLSLGTADGGQGLNRCNMLGLQTRIWTIVSDLFNSNLLSSKSGERQTCTDDLPATFEQIARYLNQC